MGIYAIAFLAMAVGYLVIGFSPTYAMVLAGLAIAGELGACSGEDIELLKGIDRSPRRLQSTLLDLHGNDQGNGKAVE